MVRAMPWLVTLASMSQVACRENPTTAPATPSVGAAVAPTPDIALAPTPTGPVVPMLYVVRKGAAESHVLGTLDRGIDASRLPPTVWSPFAAAKLVVLEWNFGDRTTGLRELMMRQDGSKLSDGLTPAERTALAGGVRPGAADLESAATWMTTAVVSATGLPSTDAIQAVLADRAVQQQQPVTYLETMAVQVARTARWLDARALSALLADVGAVRRGNDAYLAAYARGDAAELARRRGDRTPWKTAGRTGAELAQLEAETLSDRHATWMAALAPTLEAGGAFVAVDVSHLVGPGNLLDRLRTAGFDVTRASQP